MNAAVVNWTFGLIIVAVVGFAGARWWRRRGPGRMGEKGFPRPTTEWKNTTTGKTFTISTPMTTPDGKPVNPVVRKGAFSVVWPKQTFRKHFK